MLRMYDRRDRAHRVGMICDAVPIVGRHHFAPAWQMTEAEAWAQACDYIRKNLLSPLELGCKLIEPPTQPTYCHDPGTEIHPDLPKELAATFSARYRRAESREVLGFVPTRKALNIFGCLAAKSGSAFHASHDMLLCDIWLLNRHRGLWVYEPQPPQGRRDFEVQVDAGIFDENRLPQVWIEAAGDYRADRITKLLEFSNGSGVPLELW